MKRERGFGMEELGKVESSDLPKPKFVLDKSNFLNVELYRVAPPIVLSGINELREHKSLTTKQYEKISGLSERQARNHLKDLVENGYAKKEGTKYVWIW